MVSAFLIDAINNPTKVVQELFEEHTGDVNQFPAVVARHFSDVFLNSDDTLREVGIYGIFAVTPSLLILMLLGPSVGCEPSP